MAWNVFGADFRSACIVLAFRLRGGKSEMGFPSYILPISL
jgi:hypothetical protein